MSESLLNSTYSNCLLKLQGLQAQGMSLAVDLDVLPAQVWMLYGASGSGKSQFLKSIADLIEHQGQASLNGQLQTEVMPENWRQQVMYFSAESAWWLETVSEHFKILPSPVTLQALGLDEAYLSKNPETLSSGEKQRLALLRGLSYQPSVLLLDEITANLDDETTLKVERYLQAYLQGTEALEGMKEQENTSSISSIETLPRTFPGAIIWVSHDTRQRHRMTSPKQQLEFKK